MKFGDAELSELPDTHEQEDSGREVTRINVAVEARGFLLTIRNGLGNEQHRGKPVAGTIPCVAERDREKTKKRRKKKNE